MVRGWVDVCSFLSSLSVECSHRSMYFFVVLFYDNNFFESCADCGFRPWETHRTGSCSIKRVFVPIHPPGDAVPQTLLIIMHSTLIAVPNPYLPLLVPSSVLA